MVQWLGLGAFTVMAPSSIPGQGTKIPEAAQRSQKNKRKKPKDIKQVNNKVLLYSTANYIQYSIIDHNGKEYTCMYVYIYV